jgi:hypothetical protein
VQLELLANLSIPNLQALLTHSLINLTKFQQFIFTFTNTNNLIMKSSKQINIVFLLALTVFPVLATIGIIPLTIAGVQTQRIASAGCGYSRITWSWWGTYTYLDKCAALTTSYEMLNQGGSTYVAALNASKYLGPHVVALSGAVTFNRYVVGRSLQSCANRYGQAYLKYPYSFVGLAAEVTCR